MILLWWIPNIVHFSKPRECTTGRVNPYINYELQITIMYKYWFINYNKYTTLMQDVNNRGNRGAGRAGRGRGYMETLYFLLSFPVNLKLLKIK